VARRHATPVPGSIQTTNTRRLRRPRTLPARALRLRIDVLLVRSRQSFAPQVPGTRHQFFTLL